MLLEKTSYIGTLLKSFPQGEQAIGKLLEIILSRKRIERITERIGAERLIEADQEIAAFESLKLMEKVEGPKDVTPPVSCAVMADGGRHQRTQRNAECDKKSHWYEYKAGLCLELKGRRDGIAAGSDAPDPCPDVPSFLLNLEQVETLTREIGQKAASMPETDQSPEAGIELEAVSNLETLEGLVAAATVGQSLESDSSRELPLSPEVTRRDVVATLESSDRFGLKLAARAWQLGMFQAQFKAFVGDGSSWIWTIYNTWFRPFGFTAIVDIIHAVTYLYAAAMAARKVSEGGPVYRQWVTWLWQGNLSLVIEALARRQAELGLPTEADGDTSPCRIVSSALTYFQNQQSRMDYPTYRKLGLPITSSHMESTIRELNYRIKGTEKFWSKGGGEAVLQLKSDHLSASDLLSTFWKTRQATRSGFHRNVGKRQPRKTAAAV